MVKTTLYPLILETDWLSIDEANKKLKCTVRSISSGLSISEDLDKSYFNKFLNSKIENGDIVYFCKSSLTSRDKIKLYCEENKINLHKTNRVDYANTFVFNYEDVKRLFHSNTFKEYYINTQFENPISLSITGKAAKHSNVSLAEVFTQDSSIEEVYKRSWHPPSFPKPLLGNNKVKAWIPNSTRHEDFIKTLSVCLSKPDVKIVYDQSILKTINNQDIDLEAFSNIRSMMRSHQKDDQRIGIELLSNCNPEVNKVPIILLLIENWYKLNYLKTENKSFKVLIEFYKNYNFGADWRVLFDTLIKDIKHTEVSEIHRSML